MAASNTRGGIQQDKGDVVLRRGATDQATLRHPSGVGATSIHELPSESGTRRLVARDTTDTLTNKTMTGTGNTFQDFQADSTTGTARRVVIDSAGASDSTTTTLDFYHTRNRTLTFPQAHDKIAGIVSPTIPLM